jgi:hypothetical protein
MISAEAPVLFAKVTIQIWLHNSTADTESIANVGESGLQLLAAPCCVPIIFHLRRHVRCSSLS